MCLLCGDGTASHDGFEIVSRPAERLAGTWWRGGFDALMGGGLIRALHKVRGSALRLDRRFVGPVVCVSRIEAGDRFACFCGVGAELFGEERSDPGDASAGATLPRADTLSRAGSAGAAGDAVADGLDQLDLPEHDYAAAWHGSADGSVPDRYRAMLAWLQQVGIGREVSVLHHREEYPADADFAAQVDVRLMVGVRAGSRARWRGQASRFRAEAVG